MRKFFESYEIIDPEPLLHFEEYRKGGLERYHWPDVLAHVAWHGRATAFWMKNVAGKYHRDEATV